MGCAVRDRRAPAADLCLGGASGSRGGGRSSAKHPGRRRRPYIRPQDTLVRRDGGPGNRHSRRCTARAPLSRSASRAPVYNPSATRTEFPVSARTAAGERRGANIVGVIRGTTRPTRYLLLSAHYDHVGIQSGQIYNGADDNASGTAALFAIGAYLARHPLGSSLLVAAFDGEEAELAGSRAFVASPPVERGAIAIDINMDMIGRDAKDTLFVVGTARQPDLRAAIDRVAANAPVRLRVGHDGGATGEDWIRDSDHYAFLEAGVPALYFGVEDYAQLHRPTDDFDTMTLPFYVHAVETIIAVLREFDGLR